MSTQETEFPDCQERVGLKRKLTGPPRLLLGKSNKSKEKADSQRRQRRDKCCEDMSENIAKQQELSHNSPQKNPELEEPEHDAQGDTSGILVTLEENQGKEENLDDKAGSASKTTIKRTLSSLLCSGRGRKESDCDGHAEDRTENSPQETKKNKNKAHKDTNSPYENKQCDANNKIVTREKGKRNFFLMLWPISKRSSNVSEGRQEQGDSVVLQETQPKAPFKKMYRMFPRRKKAQSPIDQLECDVSTTAHNEVAGDQMNQLSTANMEIPSIHKQEHQEEEQKIEESTPETFTISAEVSINTNIESGHIDDELEICPDPNVGQIKNKDQHPVLEPTNEILQTNVLLDSSCSFDCALPNTSIGDVLNDVDQKESDQFFKCKPVITIERVYTPEEENQEDNVNQSRFDFLSMNGSWQHLKINHLTNNTLHPSDPSVSPEPDHSRCNETLLIQTAISMVQAAIRGAVEQFANEQQHNQISLDRA
nr:uncharacterized protein si:dkey-1h6.8 [Misgurnus anguillicaudatus]